MNKFDFVLYDDDDFEKLVFRFYPNLSNCFDKNDKPAKKWEDVYNECYYYKILKYNKHTDKDYSVVFDSKGDEYSEIYNLSDTLIHLSRGQKEMELTSPLGNFKIKISDDEDFESDCGVDWRLKKYNDYDYKFELFRFSDDIGYRFWLPKEKAYKFGEYLNYCCEYVLRHETERDELW